MLMNYGYFRAKGGRQTLYWLAFSGSFAAWAYLRFKLGFPEFVDSLLVIALLAEAALVLGHR
jgi:hypothetical protein